MDKREFLIRSGAVLAGGMLAGRASSDQKEQGRTNWAGNYRYSTDELHTPGSVAEVRQVVEKCEKARVLGTRHSFNGIADSTENQISLVNFKQMKIDRANGTVAVGAGVSYGELAPYLYRQGFALHNLASLPHISVAGAVSTATHGSGVRNGNLATSVRGLELVTADGKPVMLTPGKNGDAFEGAVVGLGAVGVITTVTLRLLPAFDVSQVVYENLPFSVLKSHLNEVFSSGYSVSLFTDWQNHRATQVWIKSIAGPDRSTPAKAEFFGATLAKRKLHPLAGHSAENCTDQMGIPGPWYERLPHFRMNFTPSSGDELQSEYFVPADRAYEAILAVEELREHVSPLLQISELRTIAADHLWMSPCYQRDSMTIHFTWKPDWPAVKEVLPLIERKLAPFDARPHWAKLYTMSPARLQSLYAKLPDYKNLLKQYDPKGKFRNRYIEERLYAA